MQTSLSGPAGLCLLLLMGCGARAPARAADPSAGPAAKTCLTGGGAFLRASLRGAVNADLDWRDAQISCEGSARPDGSGLRITIAGPLPVEAGQATPRRLRFVFGIDAPGPGESGQALPTNLTAIIEGEQQLFATRGDDKCTTDQLRRSAAPDADAKQQRVEARGFCTGPASALDGSARLLVTTFDFATGMSTEEPQ